MSSTAPSTAPPVPVVEGLFLPMLSPLEDPLEPGLALRRWVAGLGIASCETPRYPEAPPEAE